MTDTPRFEYYLSQTSHPISKDSPLWESPLPTNRKLEKGGDVAVSYEDYFCAVQSFMEKKGLAMMGSVVSEYKNHWTNIQEIRVFLDKHGQYYHPARVEAVMNAMTITFVLNVAISTAGRSCLEKEYYLLNKLQESRTYPFTPKVYGQGKVLTRNGHRIGMFLGEWFEGFHEFHLSFHPGQQRNKILVWSSEKEPFWLTNDQTMALYRQAAMMLTYYYNVETFEQIFSWHHAAGDFVLKRQDHSVQLRLITIRKYASMVKNDNQDIQNDNQDIQSIFEALLIFFLNLSIRMRLDRLDGIGDVVWADDIAVKGTIQGFFEGLSMKPPLPLISVSLDECFRYYLSTLNEMDLYEYAKAISCSYHPESPDFPVIQKQLKGHIAVLYRAINKGP